MSPGKGDGKGRARYHPDTKSLKIPSTVKIPNLEARILLFPVT